MRYDGAEEEASSRARELQAALNASDLTSEEAFAVITGAIKSALDVGYDKGYKVSEARSIAHTEHAVEQERLRHTPGNALYTYSYPGYGNSPD